MLFVPPTGSTDPNANYVGKNIAAGTQGSKVPPGAIEYPQRELVALIAAGGLTPTNSLLVQAAMALARGVFVGNLTGTGDLAVATLGVVFPSLLQGMRIGAVATATNTTTTPKLRVVNLGSTGGSSDFPIILEDGSVPAIGAIKAGRRYRYEADGAGNVMISGGGIGFVSGVGPNNSGALGQFVLLTGAGSGNWLVLPGWLRTRGRLIGGGGGGGGTAGSGGGAGEFALGDSDTTPGANAAYAIGGGGGGSATGNGGNGGVTAIFGITANGGTAGGTGGNPGQGGTGGTGGSYRKPGGAGGDLDGVQSYGPGGTAAGEPSTHFGSLTLAGLGEGGSATSSAAAIGAQGFAGNSGGILLECIKAA